MQNQNNNTFQQQLGLCAEIESNLFTLSQSVKQMDKEINNEKIVLPTHVEPNKPYYDSLPSLIFSAVGEFFSTLFPGLFFIILGGFFIIPIGVLILAFIIDIFSKNITFEQASEKSFFIVLGLLVVILIIRFLIILVSEVKDGVSENVNRKHNYEYLKGEYEKELKCCTEHNKKSGIRKSTLEAMKNRTIEAYNHVNNNLAPLYDQIHIPQKYRSFVAITTIYDYFLCNRVDTLREAINMYEQELRLNTIITKLDDIIDRLDSIQDTQSILYNEIINSNNKMNNFMKDINEKLSIANYNHSVNNQISNKILEECELNSFNTSLILYSTEMLRKSLNQ